MSFSVVFLKRYLHLIIIVLDACASLLLHMLPSIRSAHLKKTPEDAEKNFKKVSIASSRNSYLLYTQVRNVQFLITKIIFFAESLKLLQVSNVGRS